MTAGASRSSRRTAPDTTATGRTSCKRGATMPKVASPIPEMIRPYIFHGLPLDWEGREWASCDCPNCGRGGDKFAVNVVEGHYRCVVCEFHGGGWTLFLRWLWEKSNEATTEYDEFAHDRGLLY